MQTSHEQSDTSMETTSSASRETHPVLAAAFPTADVTLLSKDDVLFPISSTTLSRTSSWFRAMFTLPQGTRLTSGTEPIAVSESSEVLAHLLSMISGISLPPLDNVDDIEALLYAAEKYEMAMASAVLRLALGRLVPSSPIRVFSIACRMSWEDEAKAAASRTLELDIMSEDHAKGLGRLEATHLMKLLLLHDRRRKMVIAALADPVEFNADNESGRRCNGAEESCNELEDHSTWWALKVAWITEPWRFLCLAQVDANARSLPPELEACLDDTCQNCGKSLYNRRGTLENLQTIAQRLPQTIEWP
ncbi:hypothetical protein LXA43DRAFT_268288 [Ganoderma leucocontextum]|nr:hypothetical protein LXA43DRAFT_268288 [Ganoderma leucocontextum]